MEESVLLYVLLITKSRSLVFLELLEKLRECCGIVLQLSLLDQKELCIITCYYHGCYY